jgi:hypothetical protein
MAECRYHVYRSILLIVERLRRTRQENAARVNINPIAFFDKEYIVIDYITKISITLSLYKRSALMASQMHTTKK